MSLALSPGSDFASKGFIGSGDTHLSSQETGVSSLFAELRPPPIFQPPGKGFAQEIVQCHYVPVRFPQGGENAHCLGRGSGLANQQQLLP